jgi:hypothetical protein
MEAHMTERQIRIAAAILSGTARPEEQFELAESILAECHHPVEHQGLAHGDAESTTGFLVCFLCDKRLKKYTGEMWALKKRHGEARDARVEAIAAEMRRLPFQPQTIMDVAPTFVKTAIAGVATINADNVEVKAGQAITAECVHDKLGPHWSIKVDDGSPIPMVQARGTYVDGNGVETRLYVNAPLDAETPAPNRDPRVDWTIGTRPGVMGGEWSCCFHVPPLHEPGCKRLRCQKPEPCACCVCWNAAT